MGIMRRGKQLCLRSRVPARYASFEPRVEIWLSLHTDSETIAKQKEPIILAKQIEAWEARLAGNPEDAKQRLTAAQQLAAVRGYRYLSAEKVAELPRSELLARIETVKALKSAPQEAAILGGVTSPAITIERALELYWDLARDRVHGMDKNQVRCWENPLKKAFKNLISVIGNKAIADITGDDMLDFREWWLDRIENEDLTAGSANKDLTHLSVVLRTVNKLKCLGLVLPLTDLKLKEGEAATRPPFSVAWIKDQLLSPDALDGLNDQARAIIIIMVNTGMRPSEVACLSAGEIHLANVIPNVSLEGVNRKLKSARARRIIPLLGVSLEAMKAFPYGFDRYGGNPAGLSGTINKYLRENHLLETLKHTLYSLRHSFEDRMLAAKVNERIRRDLMGHSLGPEKYGTGATLEMLSELLQPVSF